MKKIISYIWKFIKPYRKKLVVMLFLLLGVTATTLVEPYMYKQIIDLLAESFAENMEQNGAVIWYLGIWGCTSLVGLILYSFYRYHIDMIFLSVHEDFYVYAFNKIVHLDIRRHLEKKSGEMIKKMDNASEAIFWIPFDFFLSLLPSWFSFFAIIATATFLHWQMTLIACAMIPVYILIFVLGGMKTSAKQRKSIDNYNAAIGRAYDTAANIQIVKSYVQERRENTLFSKLVEDATIFQKKISFFWSLLGTAEFFLSILTRFIIFAGGLFFIQQGTLSIGTLIMFLAFSNYIYSPLQVLGSQIQGIQRKAIDLEKGKLFIEQMPEVMDMPNAAPLRVKKGEIVFDNISFSYTPKKQVLRNLSFSIPAGKMTAIVGHSGAGKSTIISLLNRFYDIQKGHMYIDGKDIRFVTQESLRKNIGIVMQENTMFNDTIFNNIHYGNPRTSRKQVEEAAKKARIHESIRSWPDKYETKVGERGLKLSGGEKQRVALARVILKNPPILVLDEATSSLDSETEKEIQGALETVMKNRTTIVIAHRLSTVRKADQIIVLEKGKVLEIGTHQSLIQQDGMYKKLVDLQVGGFLAE